MTTVTDEERSRILQDLISRANPKPEAPTLASTPEPSGEASGASTAGVSFYSNLVSYLTPSSISASTTPSSASHLILNALHVHVEGVPFQYSLTEADLTLVFSRYGPVRLVHVNLDGSSAVIYYFSVADAHRALLELDGKILSGIQGVLRVRPVSSSSNPTSLDSPPTVLLPSVSPAPVLAAETPPVFLSMPTSAASAGSCSPSPTSAVRKYTCRFEIGIENDKDFYVARRLIGPKGAQMKRILMACEGPETPKLRLRGIGSGFLEGTLKQESPEPLHLCISCKDYANYRRAIDMVTDLLLNIYREYADFCRIRSLTDRPIPILSYRETPLVSHIASIPPQATPSPGLTPLPTPSPSSSCQQQQHLRAGWAQMAGGLAFPGAAAHGLLLASSTAPAEAAPPGLAVMTGEMSENERGDILSLVEERNAHRARGNYQEADRIRELLRAKGVGLMDEPGGRGRGSEVTTWRMWRGGEAGVKNFV